MGMIGYQDTGMNQAVEFLSHILRIIQITTIILLGQKAGLR